MLALLIPSTIGLMVLAKPVVRLLFERGEFTALRSTPMTASALFFYASGLCGYGGVKAVVQAFYSMKDTVTPMKVAVLNVGLNVALDIILVRHLGLAGLALATAISSAVGFAVLCYLLRRRLGDIRAGEIWGAVAKLVVAAGVMGVMIYTVSAWLDPQAVRIGGKFAQVGISAAAGLAVFVGIGFALRIREVIFVMENLLHIRVRK
jgi:putative peptidoglycan lipid II flippase